MASPIKGRFFDGQQSRPFEADISISADELLICYLDEGIEKRLQWPVASLKVMVPPHQERAAVIGSEVSVGARLNFNDRAFYQTLLSFIPKKRIKHSGVHLSWRALVMLMGISIFIVLGVLQLVNILAPVIAKNLPLSWEEALGRYVIEELAAGRNECIAPAGVKALNKIEKKLTKTHPLPFKIHVIQFDQEDINAFAVPGYYLVLMSGLIDFADNAEEVAGVLAHEMGHAIEHHPTQGILRMLGIRMIMAATFGSSSKYVSSLLLLRHSRQAEQQADEIAYQLLNQANIDQKGLIHFFEKILKEQGADDEEDKWLTYLSSHPGTVARIKSLQQHEPPAHPQPLLTPSEWQALKHICDQTAPLSLHSE